MTRLSKLISHTQRKTKTGSKTVIEISGDATPSSSVPLCRDFARNKCKRKKCKFRHTLPDGTQKLLDQIDTLNKALPVALRVTHPVQKLQQFQSKVDKAKTDKKGKNSKKKVKRCVWAYRGLFCPYENKCHFEHPTVPVKLPTGVTAKHTTNDSATAPIGTAATSSSQAETASQQQSGHYSCQLHSYNPCQHNAPIQSYAPQVPMPVVSPQLQYVRPAPMLPSSMYTPHAYNSQAHSHVMPRRTPFYNDWAHGSPFSQPIFC